LSKSRPADNLRFTTATGHLGHGALRALRAAARHHHVRARVGQHLRRLQPDARVASCGNTSRREGGVSVAMGCGDSFSRCIFLLVDCAQILLAPLLHRVYSPVTMATLPERSSLHPMVMPIVACACFWVCMCACGMRRACNECNGNGTNCWEKKSGFLCGLPLSTPGALRFCQSFKIALPRDKRPSGLQRAP
jgi:hypothetical protein